MAKAASLFKLTKIQKNISHIIATAFFVGHSPFAPGTMGTLVGIAIYLPIRNSHTIQVFSAMITIIIGVICAHMYAGLLKQKDPREIVIDEVAGIFIAFLFIPYSLKACIIGFVIFRIFDIFKPFPVRDLEKLPGGYGIMADDVMAGVYTNLVLRAIIALRLL